MRANDFVVPFLVIAVGWVVTRFQLREHHNSSFKLLCGREYIGKVAELGAQLWYPIAIHVIAGRGSLEARDKRCWKK